MATKNIEINIKNSTNTYDQLYPKSFDTNVYLSDDIISALNLGSNATLKDALEKTGNSGVFVKNYELNLYEEINLDFSSMTEGTDFEIPLKQSISAEGINAYRRLNCRILQDNGDKWLVGILDLREIDYFYVDNSSSIVLYSFDYADIHDQYEAKIYESIYPDFANLISNDSVEAMGEYGSLIDYTPKNKIFPLSSYEMGFNVSSISSQDRPGNEGQRINDSYLDYLKTLSSYYTLFSRSCSKQGRFTYSNNFNNFFTATWNDAQNTAFVPWAFWIPKSVKYSYYIDSNGNNVFSSSKLTDIYPVLCNAQGNITNSVYLGYYIGTNAPFTISCEFPIKMLILGNVPQDYYNNQPNYYIINPYTAEFTRLNSSEKVTLSWSENKKSVTITNWDLNNVGKRYNYIVFG